MQPLLLGGKEENAFVHRVSELFNLKSDEVFEFSQSTLSGSVGTKKIAKFLITKTSQFGPKFHQKSIFNKSQSNCGQTLCQTSRSLKTNLLQTFSSKFKAYI